MLGDYKFTTSAVGFGIAGIFLEPSKLRRGRLLEAAIEAGIRHFDTAPIYGLGLAEGELGRALRGRRGDVVIATKVGIGLTPLAEVLSKVQGPARQILRTFPSLRQRARTSAASPSSGRFGGLLYESTFDAMSAQRSLERSLRELGTDYVDLLLLHDPEPGLFNPEEVYDMLEGARVSGKIRAWGVAGEPEPVAAVIDALPGPTPVVQVRDDIFRQADRPALSPKSDYLITFGVLGFALPKILAHLATDVERTRQWSTAVGADCASPQTIANLLLKDAARANAAGTVLYSTTRLERVRDAAACLSTAPNQPDASLDAFRRLVAEQFKWRESKPGADQ